MIDIAKLPEQPAHEHFACTSYDTPFVLALVIKRTYDLTAIGGCRLADEQLPVHDDAVEYAPVESPLVAIHKWDNDLFALKTLTDVVVQGSAQSYGKVCAEAVVELKVANIHRKIRVFGNRIVYWINGEPLFTHPEPFETMPIRYDHAYGGQDRVAFGRHGDFLAELFTSVRPEWELERTSPFHYPRNPAGKGFVIAADRESYEGLAVPNLEWLNDPLTPSRLAVGEVQKWMSGSLPASFDWYDQANFPRIAYLAPMEPHHEIPADGVPEIQLGYASADLLSAPSIFEQQLHPLFVQGATPGLSVKELRPDESITLVNMFPESPQKTLNLPGEVPHVKVLLPKRKTVRMKPFLSSVVVRPEDNQLVTVWSCRSEVERSYAEPEYPYLPYEVVWKRR